MSTKITIALLTMLLSVAGAANAKGRYIDRK